MNGSLIIPPSPDETALFDRIAAQELSVPNDGSGIGRLNEKRMHRILRRFVSDDPGTYEKDMGGRYIADIFDGERIWEVQTGSMQPLREKIGYYLENTPFPVTIVHPVADTKYVVWIDPEDGSVSGRNRSPKKQNAMSALAGTVFIAEYLKTGRVSVRSLFIEEEEYRLLNGRRSRDRKRGSERFERLPSKLLGSMTLSSPADAAGLIPDDFPERFTAAELSKICRLRGRDIYRAARALELLGLSEQNGKRGRASEWRLVCRQDT